MTDNQKKARDIAWTCIREEWGAHLTKMDVTFMSDLIVTRLVEAGLIEGVD